MTFNLPPAAPMGACLPAWNMDDRHAEGECDTFHGVSRDTPTQCWGETAHGGQCYRQQVTDLGLCEEHLTKFREWSEDDGG